MAQYVFDTVGCPTPSRVLVLGTNPNPDYLRCLTLIGMKQILGSRCVEVCSVPHIYEDYPTPERLYGRGFTYSCILPVSAKPPPVTMQDILSGAFDLVVYGSLHRGLPYLNEVTASYPPERVVFLCGEDCDGEVHSCGDGEALSSKGFQVFVRELS
jgi:hypothetical protein